MSMSEMMNELIRRGLVSTGKSDAPTRPSRLVYKESFSAYQSAFEKPKSDSGAACQTGMMSSKK